MKPFSPRRRLVFRVTGMVVAVALAVLLSPVLVAKLIADARGAR